MTIRAVVFDMDGVLIDARDWHYEALNKALALFGFEISLFDHMSTYDGLPTRRKLEMLTLERGLPRQLHNFIGELKQRYTMEIVHVRCKPVFQHEYALARLHKEGYQLAVASNSIRYTVEAMMRAAGLDCYLDLQLSNNDVVAPKPHPEIYLKAMEVLGVQPGECLIVEDNEHGIAAAQASGARVKIVTSPRDVTYTSLRHSIQAEESGETR